jgi:predicted Zn-dependent peptidase
MKTQLFKCIPSLLLTSSLVVFLSCSVEKDSSIDAQLNDANSSENNHSSMQVIKRTLENGLTVYLSPNHEEPRFYAEIITRAGSKHDPATNTGLAHYLEHLLFKGTSSFGTVDYEKEKVLLDEITELYENRSKENNETKRKEIYKRINEVSTKAAALAIPNEMDRTYSDMGGKGINAHTWHEETVYKIDLPGNRLEHWAKIESDRFARPVFRLFHTELETVYEEKNRSIDNKDRLLQREVNSLLFKVHPYGQQPTLGSIEHLKNPSIKAIEGFYAKHYVPENMAICISGDIDPDKTFALIKEHFSSWKNPGPLRPEPKWSETGLQGREFVQVQYLGEEQLLLAFRTAPRHHEDYHALRLMDMILDNSVAGLINLNLVEKQKVRAAGCFPQNYNDHGVQFFYGIPKDGQSLEEAEKLILSEIEKIKKGEFEDWILPAVVNDFKKKRKEDLESNVKRVEMMRDTFLSFVEWEITEREIEEIQKLSKEDVIRVAEKYFGTNYVAGFRIDAQHELPSIEKPKIDPLKIDPDKESSFMKEVHALNFDPFEPKFVEENKDFTVMEVADGIRLIHARNPLNDLFTLEVRMEEGYRHQPMLPYVKRMLDRSGAEETSAEDLKIEWYKLGTGFSFGVGDLLSTFALSGLDENLEPSLDLARKLLQTPGISSEKWEESKKIMLSERDDEQKDSRALSNALAHFHRYGEKSRFVDRPTDAELNATTVEGLSGALASLLKTERTILYYGPRSPAEILEAIKEGFLSQKPTRTIEPIPPNRSLAPAKSQVYFLQKEMAQAQVRLEFAVGVYDENKAPAGQLFNEYFGGGMAGLVFQELREARALAYSAWAHFFNPSRPNEENILVGAIGCQADKTLEAVNAFMELLEDMPINDTRWKSAHASILSAYRTNPIGYRSTPAFVYDVRALGLDGDPRRKRYEALRAAEIKLLEEFYEKEIKPKAKLLSIVGDSDKIDLEKLSEIGPVTKVKAEDLFTR